MNTKKIDYDALTSVVVILFGIVYSIMSYMLPRAAIGNANDPIYFPLGLGILLIIIGLLLWIKSDKSKLKETLQSFNHKTDKEKVVSKMIVMTCFFAVLYGLTLEMLGFVISTFIFMMGVLWITNKNKHLVNTLVAVIFSVSIFAIFNYALGIPLPGLPF